MSLLLALLLDDVVEYFLARDTEPLSVLAPFGSPARHCPSVDSRAVKRSLESHSTEVYGSISLDSFGETEEFPSPPDLLLDRVVGRGAR